MSDKPDRPHDRFFKNTFSDVANASAELRSILPSEVVGLLHWESMQLESGNFETTKDRNRFCDLLFSVGRTQGDGKVLVYVLFEHESSDDPAMSLRMLRYMVNVWERWAESDAGRGHALPPIVPVVLSHDERGWRSARTFAERFVTDEPAPSAFARFIPDFELVVDDIAKLKDTEINARGLPPAIALSIWALRDGRSPTTLLEHTPFWARVVAALGRLPNGEEALHRIFEYLGEAAGDRSIDLEVLTANITQHATDAKEVAMNSLEKLLEKGRQQGLARGRQQGLARGRQQGLARGRQQGRAEGQREVLLKLLAAKFATLNDDDVAKVEQADTETLERYLERFVTADSVAAVLSS